MFQHFNLSRPSPGVYISMDSYSDMNMKMEEQSKELQEQILYIRAVKEEKDRIEGLFTEMADNLKQREEQLARTNTVLANTKGILKDTKKVRTKFTLRRAVNCLTLELIAGSIHNRNEEKRKMRVVNIVLPF